VNKVRKKDAETTVFGVDAKEMDNADILSMKRAMLGDE
jgi:hypothetical protein